MGRTKFIERGTNSRERHAEVKLYVDIEAYFPTSPENRLCVYPSYIEAKEAILFCDNIRD